MPKEQGLSPQIVEVDDFSGGLTDNILGAPKNKFASADNFYLQRVGDKARLLIRPAVRYASSAQIGSAERINHVFDIEEKLFQISDSRLWQNTATSYSEVAGPDNKAFNLGAKDSHYAVSVWQKHAVIANDAFANICRLYNNGSAWTVNDLGLPALINTATLVASSAGSTYTYGYAFHFFTSYTNQGVTFEEEGAITFQSATSNADIGGANTITITPPPAWSITNGVTNNYDLANLKVKIYRTVNGGTTYYYHSTQAYNFASVVDSTTDATISLASNFVLYTNGADDVPMHEQPPASKVAKVVNDILCLGYVTENGVQIPTKARFSNRGSLWSCPSEFYQEFDEEIVGIGEINVYPIYFCKNKVYRLEGFFLPDGTGGFTKKLISSTAGCMSHNSIVKTDIGLFWCGNDGWYYTDGYTVTRISNDLPKTYLNLVSTAAKRKTLFGVYYPRLQAVGWAAQSQGARSDNDKIYLTYLQAGISDNMPFTTWSGGDTSDDFTPTCLHHVAGYLYHGDKNGFMFQYQHDVYSDHMPNNESVLTVSEGLVTGAPWLYKTIIYDHQSVCFDFGSASIRKWVTKLIVALENASSISMQAYSINDKSGVLKPLKEMVASAQQVWGDLSAIWGDATARWNFTPVIELKRGFPKDGLRCFYKQLKLTNSYTLIEDSTLAEIGPATFATSIVSLPAAPTNITTRIRYATLPGAGPLVWPADCINYFISTSADGYVKQFRIKYRTASQLYVEDLTNSWPTGSHDWKIYGYRRDEVIKIVSYTIDYAPTSQTAEVYRAP